MSVIREELVAIRDEHKAPRRTQIVSDDTGSIDVVDARRGRAVRRDRDGTRIRAGGAGAHAQGAGREPGERDAVAQVIDTTALAGMLFFTDRGRAYRATVHELPKEKLTAAQNLFQFGDGEKVVAVLDARLHEADESHENLVFVTASGAVKRTALSRVRRSVGPPERDRCDEGCRRRPDRFGVPGLGRLRVAGRDGGRPGHPVQ